MNANRCPIDAESKEWIESRAAWILTQFGRDRIQNCTVILPTTDFFPRSLDGKRKEVDLLMELVAEYLGFDPGQFDRSSIDEEVSPTGAVNDLKAEELKGLWTIPDPLRLTADMARALCQTNLHGHELLTTEADDDWPLGDLLAVFLGFGIICANAVLREKNLQHELIESWEASFRGNLTMSEYGYALALFALLRGCDTKEWSKHLRPDVRKAFRDSLKHIGESGIPKLGEYHTTSLRPALFRDSDAAVNRQAMENESSEEIDFSLCSYCASSLQISDIDGICATCSESIDELESETQMEEDAIAKNDARAMKILRYSAIFFALLILVVCILLSTDVMPQFRSTLFPAR